MRTLAMASIFLGTVVLGTAAASAQYDPTLAASWNKRPETAYGSQPRSTHGRFQER